MNIFYTAVDTNLQEELNARGRTGFQDRSSNAIDYMVGKVANVRIIAYEGNSSNSGIVKNPQAILGGSQLQSGRYLPSSTTIGNEGFLSDRKYIETDINFYDQADVAKNIKNLINNRGYDPGVIAGNAYLKKTEKMDQSKRIGPYITSLEIAIGDHSMGLLNKATINISIPNVDRDLDNIEEVYFRPGRYISIDIIHPDSAIVSNSLTGGFLNSGSLPNKDRIKELYPDWDVDEFLKRISKMNQFIFEGLITSFDFSYTSDGTVDATLSVTGTSNIYTDISMYLSGDDKKKQAATPASTTENFNLQPVVNTTPTVVGNVQGIPIFGNIQNTKEIELYELISNRIEFLKGKFLTASEATSKFEQFLLPFTLDEKPSKATDHFFLVGQQYLPKIDIRNQITLEQSNFKFTGFSKRKLLEYSNYQGYKTDPAAAKARAKSLNITEAEFLTRIDNVLSGTYTTATSDSNDLTAFTTIKEELWNADLLTVAEKQKLEKDLDKANQEKQRQQEAVEKRNQAKITDAETFNTEATSNINRYITLGALIHVLNTYIIKNIKGSAKSAEIIHSDATNFSNYYPSLVSTNPEQILFLPKDPSNVQDMNSYTDLEGVVNGNGLIYYKDVVKQIDLHGLTPDALSKYGWKPWPGIYEKQGTSERMYPSRIFINLETIENITKTLTEQKTFTVKQFISRIPIFMYLTDYREKSLEDVITKLQPKLFKKVTGLETSDFNILVQKGVFNKPLLNSAIRDFKKYEEPSLNYYNTHIGLYDTVVKKKDYNPIFINQS
jgi:hypothetical protein